MENQQQNAAPQGAANGAALTMVQVLDAHVAAGKMVGFIINRREGATCFHVSQRAAVYLLQALEGKLENHEEGAVAAGRATQIEYWYGGHRAVLGTYSRFEIFDFWRGIGGYCKRKMKAVMRKVRQAKRKRLNAEKGGAAL